MNSNNKSSILYVLPCLDYGGAELQAITQINAWHQKGYKVYLLLLNEIICLEEQLVIPPTQIYTLHFPYTTPSLSSIVKGRELVNPIAKIIQEQQIKQVIAVLPLSHYILRLVKLRAFRNKKDSFQLIVYHCSMQYEANPLNTLGKKLFNKVNKQLAKRADDIGICVSKAVQGNISQGLFLRNPQVVYNAIPNPQIDAQKGITFLQERGITKDTYTLLIPGRLHPSKGHLFFFEVLRSFIDQQQLPATQLQLIIVGKGWYQATIEEGITTHQLEDYVQLTGNLENDLLLSLLAAADLVVVPSVNEAFGIVAIEALMQGGLLLCSDAGGLPEIITDGENGYLCPKLDHPTFLKKLQYLYTHRQETIIPKQRLFEDYQKRFTLAAQIKQLQEILTI